MPVQDGREERAEERRGDGRDLRLEKKKEGAAGGRWNNVLLCASFGHLPNSLRYLLPWPQEGAPASCFSKPAWAFQRTCRETIKDTFTGVHPSNNKLILRSQASNRLICHHPQGFYLGFYSNECIFYATSERRKASFICKLEECPWPKKSTKASFRLPDTSLKRWRVGKIASICWRNINICQLSFYLTY